MFLPSVHAETDTIILHQFIRENPLGMLITGVTSSLDFLQCTHVPFNPQAKGIMEALGEDSNKPNSISLENDVLVVFNGKHNHYVTPKYYVETKPDSGKVVPTWNYSAVQVYGKLTLHYDSKAPEVGAFLAKQIRDLSHQSETSIMGYTGGESPQPWKVGDAPERYIELMQRNIVGVEIRIDRIQGKFKMGQEMRAGDREGVMKGFARLGGETGEPISSMVRERGALHDERKKA
ncbi:hypothetical protein BO71DRAFT_485675 [Aspergillus ellipticus CBS 707.79]|uniref:Transcriptional regulator n=1 Tax=Aspergillus ellipticus CBS 707.79 TaxID=1448320 RepID=A0A319D3Y1_9EURO|nr:hypothetical protein BO71DRAFT_485675 [Aspergillus ellipticus CBS 707.79]